MTVITPKQLLCPGYSARLSGGIDICPSQNPTVIKLATFHRPYDFIIVFVGVHVIVTNVGVVAIIIDVVINGIGLVVGIFIAGIGEVTIFAAITILIDLTLVYN